MKKPRSKYNSLVLGLIFGLIVPVILVFVFYLLKYPDLNTGEFLRLFFDLKILTHLISLCAIPNLIIFFIFIGRNYYLSARGVILATFIIVAIVLIIRII